jgi:hypothetical protein
MDKVYTAIASAGLGAFFGLLAAWAKGYVDYLQGAARELRVAALGCLDRLEKIQQVRLDLPEEVGDEFERLPKDDERRKMLDHELLLLGGNVDRYLSAIGGARRRALRKHFGIYQDLRWILIGHEFDPVLPLIDSLREVTQTAAPTSNTATGAPRTR